MCNLDSNANQSLVFNGIDLDLLASKQTSADRHLI